MRGLAYLNYAGLAPVPPRAALAGLLPMELLGNALLPLLFRWQDDVRSRVAAWLGVQPRNVAFLPSTSHALVAVSLTLDWQPGDVVLYPREDFPSNVLPWQDLDRFGVEAIPMDDWDQEWPSRTRMVAISTVDYSTGVERPWQAVCARARTAGIWTCLDAVQTAGIKPAYTGDVDFWAAGSQKWLASGTGLALLVVGDRALEAWRGPWRWYLTFNEPRDVESGLRDSARRWEMGWITPTALLRLRSNLSYFSRLGWEVVGARVRAKRDRLHRELLGMEWNVVSCSRAWSGIVSIDPRPIDSHALVRSGYRRRVIAADRGPYLRLAAHMFTREAELDRVLDWLWSVRMEQRV